MTIARDVPGVSVYFISNEMFVRPVVISLFVTALDQLSAATMLIVVCRGRKDNVPLQFVAGGVAGMLSWALTYPQDVIKSRMQVRPANCNYYGPL